MLRVPAGVLQRDGAMDGMADHDHLAQPQCLPDLVDVVGVGIDGDLFGPERRIGGSRVPRVGGVPQVSEDQLQVPAQLRREHPGGADADPGHQARRAVALDPVPELSSVHFHDARVVLFHPPRGHERLRTPAANRTGTLDTVPAFRRSA